MIAIVRLGPERLGALRPDRREELIEWVRSQGAEPEDVRPELLIEHGESSYLLHLSRYARNDAGRLIPDYAADNVVSEPLIIDVDTEKSWPSWLTE